eukprot:TRINITY_DN7115_c0_g1_i4.p1 TRINITY_DN7115_c0_g1~~TRINITY_DN7115_c0_g1_i4.p1  ORF type:complete len:322 (-),score=59.38 TRINITY_DN7115_c0_g1_i4:152-1117(-)
MMRSIQFHGISPECRRKAFSLEKFSRMSEKSILAPSEPANTKTTGKRRSSRKKGNAQKRYPHRKKLLELLAATKGIAPLDSDVVIVSERSNEMVRCSLKLLLDDEEDPLAFTGAGFTEDQAKENAALMAIYYLKSSSLAAAAKTADKITRLTLRATEVFEKAGSDAHSADLDLESAEDFSYLFRALIHFQGIGSAHMLFDEEDPVRSVRLSRSARDAHFADKDIAKLRVDVHGKGYAFWTKIIENATQQLHPAGKGAAVQLLLDGAMGSSRKDEFHKTIFILIVNIHSEIAKLNSGAKLYFLPQKFGTEDAGSMSVLLWLA